MCWWGCVRVFVPASMSVRACACVCERERGGERDAVSTCYLQPGRSLE